MCTRHIAAILAAPANDTRTGQTQSTITLTLLTYYYYLIIYSPNVWDVGLHGLDVGKGISRSTISGNIPCPSCNYAVNVQGICEI